MPYRLQTLVAWTLIAQVLLVGGLGTGLHGLFGCEHGRAGACTSTCCSTACSTAAATSRSDCQDCAFCQRASEAAHAPSVSNSSNDPSTPAITSAGCDGCAVCELLDQYHNVTPWKLDSLAIEPASGEADVQRQNAVVAASIRLAPSRGPPAV